MPATILHAASAKEQITQRFELESDTQTNVLLDPKPWSVALLAVGHVDRLHRHGTGSGRLALRRRGAHSPVISVEPAGLLALGTCHLHNAFSLKALQDGVLHSV
jgi:hypothetical protein